MTRRRNLLIRFRRGFAAVLSWAMLLSAGISLAAPPGLAPLGQNEGEGERLPGEQQSTAKEFVPGSAGRAQCVQPRVRYCKGISFTLSAGTTLAARRAMLRLPAAAGRSDTQPMSLRC